MKFDAQIETPRLLIRSWTQNEIDQIAWHELNSDEDIMQFFPFRRTRKQADAVLGKIINTAGANGYGWAAATLKDTGEPIGFTGLSLVNFKTAFSPATEIGWRYLKQHWGKGYATEAAVALIKHGFETLSLKKIVSFAVPQNLASIAIMARLGMGAKPEFDFDMAGIDESNAHLRRHIYYEISRQDWALNQKTTAG